MFQVVEKPKKKLIFCLLDVAKCDFGEDDKTMFQVFEKPWKLIFHLPTDTRYDFGVVDKAMFQGINRP
jgi:hypothetical protein